MKASIQDVASEAGVSVSTVSRTLSKPDLVLPDTRDKVLSAARKLEYHASRSAASLKSGQTMRIALLPSSDITTWFNSNVYAGLDSVFHPNGYDISIFPMTSADERQRFFADLPVRRNADAVLVSSFNIDTSEVGKLKDMNVPLVGINVPSTEGFDATVNINDIHAMSIAVNHLLSLGHRHLAYAYEVPDDSHHLHFSADIRHKGFLQACEANPQAVPELISIPNHADTTNTILNYLTASDHHPTAVCFQNDETAFPVLYRLRQYGHRVPQDISLIGFDDLPLSKQIGFTTLRQDPFDLGRRAALKTLEAISGSSADPQFEDQPVQLIIRETTAVASQQAVGA